MKTTVPLILASNSPRRQQLLRAAGFEFEVVVRPVEEVVPENLPPRAAAIEIAETKAKAYPDLAQDHLIITADTVVVLDHKILGKPKDDTDAIQMLQSLSGRSHEVVSAVCLFHQDRLKSFAQSTKVSFRQLTEGEIRHYIKHYQPFDKAGSYGIQEGLGMIAITGIEGDYYNVMGLPLASLYRELAEFEGGG